MQSFSRAAGGKSTPVDTPGQTWVSQTWVSKIWPNLLEMGKSPCSSPRSVARITPVERSIDADYGNSVTRP
jgi:hypothetical protein